MLQWIKRQFIQEIKLPLVDLSTQDGYDIASAIRGPDNPQFDFVKTALTARIRDLVGSYGGEIRHETMTTAQIKSILYALSNNPPGVRHYLRHIQNAARVIGANNLYGAVNMMLVFVNEEGKDIDEELLLDLLNEGI